MTAYMIPVRWSDSDCFKIRRADGSGNEKYHARTDAFAHTARHPGDSLRLSCRGNRSEGGADIPVCPLGPLLFTSTLCVAICAFVRTSPSLPPLRGVAEAEPAPDCVPCMGRRGWRRLMRWGDVKPSHTVSIVHSPVADEGSTPAWDHPRTSGGRFDLIAA